TSPRCSASWGFVTGLRRLLPFSRWSSTLRSSRCPGADGLFLQVVSKTGAFGLPFFWFRVLVQGSRLVSFSETRCEYVPVLSAPPSMAPKDFRKPHHPTPP